MKKWIHAQYDIDDGTESAWKLVEHKSVQDTDGFWTDLSLYHNIVTDEWGVIFGDRDLYNPETSGIDDVFEEEWEAREWYDSECDDPDLDPLD